MKAIEITQYGGPDVLKPAERPMPEPGAGEVLIRVRAAGVNRPDVFQRTGNYPVPPGLPIFRAWKWPAKSLAAIWRTPITGTA